MKSQFSMEQDEGSGDLPDPSERSKIKTSQG